MQGFIFSQSDCTSVCEGYTHLTEGLGSLNEKMFSIYLHCTIALQAVFGQDPRSELAIISQQFHPLFPSLPVLSCQNESTSTLHCQRQLPQPAKTKKKKEKSEQLSLTWVSLFQCEHFMYEVWERLLKCISSMQICNYSNSDDESACWVTAQNNSLERFVTVLKDFFNSDSGITFALQFIGFTHKSNWLNKIWSYLFEDSITEATAGSNIPSDTMQVISFSLQKQSLLATYLLRYSSAFCYFAFLSHCLCLLIKLWPR